jgi:hypothetical protein
MNYGIQDHLLVERFKHRGLKVRIRSEEEPWNPREWDNVGTMIVRHPRYIFGDRDFYSDEAEAMHRGWDFFRRYMRLTQGATVVLPLSIYDHSGVSMWVGTPYTDSYRSWDSSFVGAIVAFKEDIEKMGTPEDRVEEVLRAEVKDYNAYLTGDIYEVSIYKGKKRIETIGGFIGLNEAREEGKAMAESYV